MSEKAPLMLKKDFMKACAQAYNDLKRNGDRPHGMMVVVNGTKSLSLNLSGMLTLEDVGHGCQALAARAAGLAEKSE